MNFKFHWSNKYIYWGFKNKWCIQRRVALSLIIMIILSCKLSSSWDPSLSSSVTTQQYNYSGYSYNYGYSVALGSSSKSLYVLEYLNSPNTAVVRKIKTDNSVSWMTAVSFRPLSKGLAVDATETNVYIAVSSNPLNVWRLLVSSGSVVDAQS